MFDRLAIRHMQSGLGMTAFLVLVLILAALAGAAYFLMDWKKPVISIQLPSDYMTTKPFNIAVEDRGSGVKSVEVGIERDGQRYSVMSKTFDSPQPDAIIPLEVSRNLLGDKPGTAILTVTARDGAEHYILPGNKAEVRKEVKLDFKPPTLEVLTSQHYVNYGGSGLVIYSISDDAVVHGVQVGKHFFPGYGGHFPDPHIMMAYFAVPYDTSSDTKPNLIAEDAAGNERKASFHYQMKPRKYRERTIQVNDNFVEGKVADLLGGKHGYSEEEVFVKVNKIMRGENEAKISKLTSGHTNKKLWDGAFHQLSNSKVEANFADHRHYDYHGKIINDAWHVGYDLSVTKHYPIEAANSGVVVYADDLGIYGNTVIIDHGMGLYTLYSHMSSFGVKVGDQVNKEQILGRTGSTGLAAGDHLHYGVYLNGVAVLPLEWWDQKWINDNINRKIDEINKEFAAQKSN